MVKVFIDGKEGTTGLEIHERLARLDYVQTMEIPDDLRKDTATRAEFLNNADVAFLCLPDNAAREAVELVKNDKTVLIDASTAHRTEKDWAYGFPELSSAFRKSIENGKRIATPGCHASGFISLAYPLVSRGIISADTPLTCFSLTGYSGGGKKMIADYEREDVPVSRKAPRQYGILQMHKHLKEMKAIVGLNTAPAFCPIVDDYYRGMEVSLPIFAQYYANRYSKKNIYEFFAQYYANQPFIEVIDAENSEEFADGFIAANNMSGKNGMKIIVGGNDERVVLSSLFDNLGKGASGAAVQCLNIVCGKDETLSLL